MRKVAASGPNTRESTPEGAASQVQVVLGMVRSLKVIVLPLETKISILIVDFLLLGPGRSLGT